MRKKTYCVSWLLCALKLPEQYLTTPNSFPSAMLLITYQECSTRYGLSAVELQEFIEVGLLRPTPHENTLELDDEADELMPRLARLHHEMGINKEGIDIIVAMRQRLLQLQTELRYQTARARQLEQFLHGGNDALLNEE